MIQITPHIRIIVAVEPVDFRKGIDGLGAIVRQRLESDPFSGAMFVFVNKSRQALRLLIYDGQGFWLCHKRLSRGRFAWSFRGARASDLAARELQPRFSGVERGSFPIRPRLPSYPDRLCLEK